MARIRSIHPDVCTDETLAELSASAERTFLRLWTHLDDEGRARDNPRLLKAALYPLHDNMTASAVDADIDELESFGLIVRYEVAGERYLSAKPSWKEYQKPRHPTPTKLPGPEQADGTSTAIRRNPTAQRDATPEDDGQTLHGDGVVVGDGVGGGGGVVAAAAKTATAPTDRLPAVRPRDELWDAVLFACGINPDELTGSMRGAANKAVAELRGVNASPHDVAGRAAVWPSRYPEATLTPTALAKHWPMLDPGRTPAASGTFGRKNDDALRRAMARGRNES